MVNTWRIGNDVPEECPDFVRSCYSRVLPYFTDFLTAAHPHRNGVMCPFMPKALIEKNIRFTFFLSSNSDIQFQNLIRTCVDDFKKDTDGSPGAVIILLEEDFDIPRLLRAHIDAKRYCIKNEVMLGALFKDSQAPSLHSENYFPLRTPTPILVLRDLTSQDLQFLSPDHYGITSKIDFINSFIKKFDTPSAKGFTKNKVDEAKTIRGKYRAAIYGRILLFILLTSVISAYILGK